MFVSFAGIVAAAFYTRSSTAAPEALLVKLAFGMIGPIIGLLYAMIRRRSIVGYSKKLRNSIMAQMQASTASSVDLDDKGRQALAKAMQRPVKSLFARTNLDKKMIPSVAGIAFLAALLPAFFVGNPPREATAVVAETPAPRVAQTIQTRPVAPPAEPVQQTPAQPEMASQAAQASAPSQDDVNYCMMRVFQTDLSKSENLFIQQNLASRELDINSTDIRFNVRETQDSPGSPEFKCVGKVTVTSKSTNAPVLSYDIAYSTYMADGSSGIDQKTIARANIQPPDPAMIAQQEAERRRAQAAARQRAEAQRAREEQARREAESRRLAAQQEQARQDELARQRADVQRAREENARREAERQRQQQKGVASRVWRSIKESSRKP